MYVGFSTMICLADFNLNGGGYETKNLQVAGVLSIPGVQVSSSNVSTILRRDAQHFMIHSPRDNGIAPLKDV